MTHPAPPSGHPGPPAGDGSGAAAASNGRPGPAGDGAGVQRRTVVAWGLWDWGSAAWQAVITTFVFGPYVVHGVVGDARPGGLTGNTWLGISTAVAGLVIALVAPITGQRGDAAGKRRRSLAIWTGLVVLVMLAMFAIEDRPSYLWAALLLLATGAVMAEFAYVHYNAMLRRVCTPATLGRVSGFGWAMGYFGGIFLLLICYVGFIAPETGWFGVTREDGLAFRMVAVFSAIWFAVFALPALFLVPEKPPGPASRRAGVLASYAILFADLKDLWRSDRRAVLFLIASALYRDGLSAVFTFGAILAVTVYGLAPDQVLIFGVAANVVAGVAAVILGMVEDHIGPKRVILISLAGLIITSVILLFSHGPTMFWIFGLLLTVWVGPAQSSSRSFLVRISPLGREGQMFGLYATTGRAASMIAPGLFALFSGLVSDRAGIIGITLTLLAGALLLLAVRPPQPLPGR